jgi:hypothetical protein
MFFIHALIFMRVLPIGQLRFKMLFVMDLDDRLHVDVDKGTELIKYEGARCRLKVGYLNYISAVRKISTLIKPLAH